MRISFNLNGTNVQIEAVANERLVYVLRREFGLFSLKSSCLNGQCGSCTVLMNGKPVPSCLVPVFKVEGAEIITLEYFKTTEAYKVISAGFDQAGVEMCGFCDAGKIFFAHSILTSGLDASAQSAEEKIRRVYSSSMCRCTSFEDLFSAITRIGKSQKRK
ncbi:(2Fe-2S)-binding protein [Treponema pedis]|uniref:Iron-sulfur cluster-binding protein n=3 Tax=Treponema pedis TaxID=409322 RepID=S6A3J3_9SPIR|nr:2Fe-2S iron-sulfur cluster-binding protein [Treponema pedis]AGT43611.1 iron-sulfur cluster-binding protein [Treponema pedis str. T A4]QOW61139.1 2Fe-2S iron-sulfur cluster binding domain-containing protein [Treponema pedis]QSI04397.1 (2Fe-2S)-binding protein [Treponema pedis]